MKYPSHTTSYHCKAADFIWNYSVQYNFSQQYGGYEIQVEKFLSIQLLTAIGHILYPTQFDDLLWIKVSNLIEGS